jgi:hypothetical protein
MQGKLKIKGNMQAALRFTPDIFPKGNLWFAISFIISTIFQTESFNFWPFFEEATHRSKESIRVNIKKRWWDSEQKYSWKSWVLQK